MTKHVGSELQTCFGLFALADVLDDAEDDPLSFVELGDRPDILDLAAICGPDFEFDVVGFRRFRAGA